MKLMKSHRSEMSTTVRFGGWVNSLTVHDVHHSGEQWTSVMFFHSPTHGQSAIVRISDDGRLAAAIRGFVEGGSSTLLMDLVQTSRPIDDAGPEAHAAWESFMRELAPAL